MDNKTFGWIQIIGGSLALLFAGRIGYGGMMGMMGFYTEYNMMSYGGGIGTSILAILFIISGIYFLSNNKKK